MRAPRTCKIRLGYKKKGQNGDYPKDTDVFVLRTEDQAPEIAAEIIKAYSGERIQDADGQVFSLGKSLRMMLPWDFDLTYEGREVGLELMNRAWSHSKLRCSGTGGDEAGDAVCQDKSMLDELAKATKQKPIAREDGKSWKVTCLGPRCPFWSSNLETNKQATCHREMRLWAWLLYPAKDEKNPNFLRKLAAAEISSGSFNAMIDVQSGFRSITSLVGRTALIPFTLRRVPRTVLSGGKRVMKATLLVDFDQDEVIKFGYSDSKLALVRPEVRKQLLEQKEELLRLAALESHVPDFESFKDIVPRLEEHRSTPSESGRTDYPASPGQATGSGGGDDAGGLSAVPDSSGSVVADRDQVIDDAAEASAERMTEEQLNRRLVQGERDELKVLCGGIPGDRGSQTHFRELVTLALKDAGDWKQEWDAASPPLSELRLKHAVWIREAVEAEKGAA